ncbi:MAG: hypothetical protein ACR2FX_05640 [Chthoniobacterales bacterium]
MKPGKLTHTIAVVISFVTSLFTHAAPAEVATAKVKLSKKSDRLQEKSFFALNNVTAFLLPVKKDSPKRAERYSWKTQIVTTVFWIGEEPTSRNPVPNRSSSWDKNWSQSYGGFDNPDRARRAGYIPASFTPKQNPFYCALPYNDKASTGHRPEAPQVVPWFKEAYQGPGVSTCKGRWVAIRKGDRVAYAQWEDAGPFRTDHWQYVFGNERPKPNLNKGAGLDISPAVRDFLGLSDTDVTDWHFVDFEEVPHGPWAQYGDNNTFVMNARQKQSLRVQERINVSH